MASNNPGLRYVRRNFDEAAILAVAAKLAFEPSPSFSDSELATIAAMQRAHPSAGDNPEELGHWLAGMSEDQIAGVVSNTKGVLHEMEFARIENEDGDTVYAAVFDTSNHEGYDIQFVDLATGAVWEAQLKSTDDASYVQAWIDEHPDGEILVTQELAEDMELASSGLSNEEMTVRTEVVVERLLDASGQDSIWDYFPGMTAASVGIVVWSLFKRYRAGEISYERFKWLVAKTTGLKAGKIALLSAAMMVPGLNVVTGAALVCNLIYSAACCVGLLLPSQAGGKLPRGRGRLFLGRGIEHLIRAGRHRG